MYAEPRHREISIEAATLLSEGKLIDAIKVVRQTEGIGLKEAKARVDAYLAREPLLRAQIETQQHVARRKFFLWFLVVDVLIVAAIVWWLRA